ncbi:MAG: cell division protein FtsA [Verrucomicrobia bacterium]|nr:cell division protein FtsA [Verrucomicrobiota bacterium]
MFDSSPSVLVGLEIGTSKICAVVGEVSDDNVVNIIGVGQHPSTGVRKGEIVDSAAAAADIRAALSQAEEHADVEIRSVVLGVTGAHIHGFNNHGQHPIVSADRLICADDVLDVVKNAKATGLPAEHCVLHTIRQHFTVDGQHGIVSPVDMVGAKLEVDMHVVHAHYNRLQNPVNVLEGMQIQLQGAPVFNGLASALSALDIEQKDSGAVVLDLGAGTTEFVVYSQGVVRHLGVLAVGGDHVTNDLAYGLKVPQARAEALKLAHGCAVVEPSARGKTIALTSESGHAGRDIHVEHLQRVMSARLEETFQLIAAELDKERLLDHLGAGVVLVGGGAHIPRIHELAERVFQVRVSPRHTHTVNGVKTVLDAPEFTTAIGLVKYGSMQAQRAEPGGWFVRVFGETFGALLGR